MKSNTFVRLLLAAVFLPCLTAFSQEDGDRGASDPPLLTDDSGMERRKSRSARTRQGRSQEVREYYDALPPSFEEMDQYDQIAMEPFRNRYDAMSLAEKAAVYGKQFEYMHNRKPNFAPSVLNPSSFSAEVVENEEPDDDDDYRQRRQNIEYDPLPLYFEDMNQYDKIAMEPYRNRYDSMTVAEKAAVYGRQFEFMRNRKPAFDPDLVDVRSVKAVESERLRTDSVDYDSYRQQTSRSSKKSAEKLYKPATPKKRRPKPKPKPQPEEDGDSRPPHLLEALSGPWESIPEPEPEPEPEYEEVEEPFDIDPDTPEYPQDDLRMENLRQGWNAIDIMRGVRDR